MHKKIIKQALFKDLNTKILVVTLFVISDM